MWDIPAATAYGGILLTRGGHILPREPTNHQDGYVWTYATGRPDKGDTPEQTALREVRDETGYEAEFWPRTISRLQAAWLVDRRMK